MNEIAKDTLSRAEEILGYQFQDHAFLVEALTHASVVDDHLQSNERMEFLGDAILGYIVCEYLYDTYPDEREGELTKIKSTVVSRRACAQISDQVGLTELMQLGKGMNDRDGLPSSIAAAVYESIVAALYQDGGIEPTRRFILEYMKPLITEAAESAHQDNYKSMLQQHAQRVQADLPTYLLLDEKGPDHSKCFEVCVELGGKRYTAAWGASKKEAEQKAALAALVDLGLVEDSLE